MIAMTETPTSDSFKNLAKEYLGKIMPGVSVQMDTGEAFRLDNLGWKKRSIWTVSATLPSVQVAGGPAFVGVYLDAAGEVVGSYVSHPVGLTTVTVLNGNGFRALGRLVSIVRKANGKSSKALA